MPALWKVRFGLGAGVLTGSLLLASPGFAQGLGDVARQPRERRAQAPCSTRVYTNEDLARPQILDAKERACLDAARQTIPAATPYLETAAPTVAGFETRLPDTPLALIAPRDRLRKEARLAREARWAQEAKLARESRGAKPLRTTPVALQLEPASEVRTRVIEPAGPAPGLAPTLPAARPVKVQFAPAVHVVMSEDDGAATDAHVAPRTIQVQRGDSLWKIAARHLGDGRAWRRIATANPQIANPDRIHIGDVIRLPEAASSVEASGNAREAGPVVRVARGDTLWQLATARFGRCTAWTCIAETNQLRNPDLILPGQVLAVPEACQ